MDKRFLILTITILLSTGVYSQGELDTSSRIFYRDEKSLALMLSTKGLGVNFMYGKYVNASKKILYQVDLTEIKHPKEIKISISSPFVQSTGSFVYGKLNRFYTIRAGSGIQKELFRKIDKGGVSIRNVFTGGINLGLEKPVYYIMQDYLSSNGTLTEVTRKFSTEPHASNQIMRYASFYEGLNEIKIVPGAFVKYAYTFEYGKNDNTIHAIEGGAIFDVFPRPIHLMAFNDYDFFFVSMYLSYRFGKVVDSRFKRKRNKLDRLFLN